MTRFPAVNTFVLIIFWLLFRERLLNNMTALTYDGADAMRNMGDDDEDGGYFVHSCSDKTQSLMIVEPRNPKYRTTTDTSHLEPTTDSETNERGRHNSRSDGSVSDSSDIADEYSYSMFSRSTYDNDSYMRYQRLMSSVEDQYSTLGPISPQPFSLFCIPHHHSNHSQREHFRRVLRSCLNSVVGLVKGGKLGRRQTLY